MVIMWIWLSGMIGWLALMFCSMAGDEGRSSTDGVPQLVACAFAPLWFLVLPAMVVFWIIERLSY